MKPATNRDRADAAGLRCLALRLLESSQLPLLAMRILRDHSLGAQLLQQCSGDVAFMANVPSINTEGTSDLGIREAPAIRLE